MAAFFPLEVLYEHMWVLVGDSCEVVDCLLLIIMIIVTREKIGGEVLGA